MEIKIWFLLILACCCCSWSCEARVGANRTSKYLLDKPQCNDASQAKMELIVAKLAAVGPRGRKFPETYKEVKMFCRDTNQMMAKVESYLKNCFVKSVRDYASVLLYTLKRNIRKYCGKRGNKVVRDFIRVAPCANRYIQPREPICTNRYIEQTKQLIGVKNDKQKLPYACCYFAEAVKCVEDSLEAIPCLRDKKTAIMDLFRSGASEITSFYCGVYNDQTTACEHLGPAPAPVKPVTKQYITPFSLMIDLLESYDNGTLPMAGRGFS